MLGFSVLVGLGQPEIDNVDLVSVLAGSDQKIVWFDIPVNNSVLVDNFDNFYHLDCYQECSF